MAQVLEFKLPDLGEGLTEAEIVRWLVEVGDVVAIDQPVVEVETAKAMVEVPCPYGGVVTARYGEEGAELPVGAPLLTVAVGSVEPVAGRGDSAESADGAAESGASGNVLVGYGTGAPAARRRRVRPAPVSAASSASATPAEASAPVESSSASVAVTSTAVTSMAGTSMGAGTILAEGRTAAGGWIRSRSPERWGLRAPLRSSPLWSGSWRGSTVSISGRLSARAGTG